MNLGSLSLKNNLVLAPLLNVTTAPYRNFYRKFHDIGLVCVPMLYVKRIANNPISIRNDLEKIEKERPVSVQLIGNDLEAFKTSIINMESYKFDVLDINAGCPSKRAINSKKGGYLLKDLDHLKKILNIAVKYSSKLVSLKTRVGFSNSKSVKEIGKVVNDSGIDFLTIHARTVKNRFDNTKLDLEAVKQLKKIIDIPLIGNGDINNPITAKKFIDYTNVDAIMIGRGSTGNPMIFSQILQYLKNGSYKVFNNTKYLMEKHVELYEKAIDNYLIDTNLNYTHDEFKFAELKRNSIWLTKNLENSTTFRSKLSRTKTLKQLKAVLNNFFE
jgi:nifR3 family TIM-barrel protein